MNWQATFAQGAGAQAEQQDCGGTWHSGDGTLLFIVLADGAGGHRGGEEASKAAVKAAERSWFSEAPTMLRAAEFLESVGRAAHAAVAALPHSPRSTWLALLVGDGQAAWVHCGDTRLYHFRAGDLKTRTLDHSLVQVLVEKGKVSEADAISHADRSVLLQSLGGDRFSELDHGSCQVTLDDVFVLCTDGLWAAVPERELARLSTLPARELQHAAHDLIARAKQTGGEKADNASLSIVRPAG